MKISVTLAALAGLTTIASAQNVGTVTLTVATTQIVDSGVFDVGVVLSDNIAGNSVFAFDLLIDILGDQTFTILSGPTPDTSVFGFAGGSTASSVTGLGGASDILGPTLDPSLDGVTVFTFQVMAGNIGDVHTFAASAGDVNAAMSFGVEGGIVILPGLYDDIIFQGVTVFVTPAPGTLSLLAGAGLLAARRRR